jgi:S-DNA-T family DNA segregation ATPase FtsK/SpoIIIE
MSTLVENRLVLRLADRADFGAVGIPVKLVPDTLVDGRALTPDPVVELQVAVLADDISGAGQNAALREIAARHAGRDAATPVGLRPFRLEEMPAVAPYDDRVREAVRASADRIAQGWVPLGLGGDDLELTGLDLSGSAVAVLAGPPKSGRTNLLRFAATACREAGLPVLAVCPLPNALSRDLGPDALLADGLEEETLVARFRQLPEGTLVLVDDAELLKEGPLAQALLAMVQQARGKRWRVLVAGATAEVGAGYSGWVYEARKSRQGLLLSPQGMADGDIFSVRLMRSSLMPRVHPGRGLTIDPGGSQTLVQVPLVD